MGLLSAVLLGLVEGLTEFLPISSTGHLVLAGALLGYHDEASKAFEIVIQLGALLAVVVYYRKLLLERTAGLLTRDTKALRLWSALLLAFLPTAAVGLLVHRYSEKLQEPLPVALAFLVGGLLMLVVGSWDKRQQARGATPVDDLSQVSPVQAVLIGLGQCGSLWPGMSRSMSTIVSGQLSGLSLGTATEFSFLLALPTLGAATVFSLVKARHELLRSADSLTALAVGLVVSFVAALAVISTLLPLLKRVGLVPFAYYRVVVAIVVLVFLFVAR